MSVSQVMNDKVVPVVMKFVNMKGIVALKDGMLYTLPLNIIGSIFLLIAAFPLESFTNFMALPLNIIGSIFLLIAAFPLESFTNFMVNTFGPSWNDPLYKCQDAWQTHLEQAGMIHYLNAKVLQ